MSRRISAARARSSSVASTVGGLGDHCARGFEGLLEGRFGPRLDLKAGSLEDHA
jgi:hypothetical protein